MPLVPAPSYSAARFAWAGSSALRRDRGLHQHPKCSQPLGQENLGVLASAELAAMASKLDHIPTVTENQEAMGMVNKDGAAIYKY